MGKGRLRNRIIFGSLFSAMTIIVAFISISKAREPGLKLSPIADSSVQPAIKENNQSAQQEADVLKMPYYTRWRTFSKEDGLPSDKAFCVRADGERVWVGTDNGLALYEGGKWRAYATQDGLPHRAVLSLDVSPHTGDLWVGTMGGLARLSAGRFDVFSQASSGLSNDFIHDVACDPDSDVIWVATAMGLSRLDLRSGEWSIFTEQNTPMHEPWTYSVAVENGLVYVGAWGGGILEYNTKAGRWREYRDPDKEMEIDLLPDDGPVHDVTAGIDYVNGILWQASYFGLARYDGRQWRTYFTDDSGLANNFINFVRAKGRIAWLCTDKGLSSTDGDNWVTYRRLDNAKGELLLYQQSNLLHRRVTPNAIAHNFVLGVDFQGDKIWIATEKGVSYGEW